MRSSPSSSRISFFMAISLVGFLAVFIGFGKTLPPAIKDVKTPSIVFIHGAFAFAWLCLFFIQATLMNYNNFRAHRALGYLGIFIAIGTAMTMLPASASTVSKNLREGLGETSYSSIVGVATSAFMFLAIVIAGVLNRKNPQTHKRLMLLATILVLWVAWFRFRYYFPSVPRPDIWFGVVLPDTLIIISWIWDKYVNGRLHPVLGWVGTLIIVEQSCEVFLYDSAGWRSVGKAIFELIPGY